MVHCRAPECTPSHICERVVDQNRTGIVMAYFKVIFVEVREREYTILEDFSAPTNARFFEGVEWPHPDVGDLDGRTQIDFLSLSYGYARQESCAYWWGTVLLEGNLQYGVEETDEADRKKGIERYSSTSHLTIETMMQTWLRQYRCFFDLYLGQFCSVIGLHQLVTKQLSFPISGVGFLVTVNGCPAQCGHKYFDHLKGTGPGFFVIATGEQSSDLWGADGSHRHVDVPPDAKCMIAHVMEMTLITITQQSVFIGHGYVQHAGSAWQGTESNGYHMYLIPEGHKLIYSVAFAYGWSLRKDGDPVPLLSSIFEVPSAP